MPKGLQGFQKGHKIGLGRECSEKTRRKIGITNSKPKVEIECGICKKVFFVWPVCKNAKFCSRQCAFENKKGKPTWNKGLIGWRVGEKHNWMPSGEKHWSYKKDRNTLVKRQERNDSAYREWVDSVKKRDGKCLMGMKTVTDI